MEGDWELEWDAGMVTVMICGLGEFMNVSAVFMTEVNMNKPVRRHGSSLSLLKEVMPLGIPMWFFASRDFGIAPDSQTKLHTRGSSKVFHMVEQAFLSDFH